MIRRAVEMPVRPTIALRLSSSLLTIGAMSMMMIRHFSSLCFPASVCTISCSYDWIIQFQVELSTFLSLFLFLSLHIHIHTHGYLLAVGFKLETIDSVFSVHLRIKCDWRCYPRCNKVKGVVKSIQTANKNKKKAPLSTLLRLFWGFQRLSPPLSYVSQPQQQQQPQQPQDNVRHHQLETLS